MSSPSSSSSGTAGTRRSSRPSRSTLVQWAAAALLAAAAAWTPVSFLFVYGPLGFALWVVVVIGLAIAVNGNTGLCPD